MHRALTFLKNYFTRHAQNCVGSLGQMSRHRLSSALTIAVIGIALAMPSALNIVVKSGRDVAGGWDNVRDFSAYMQPGTALKSAARLGDQIEAREIIESVQLISADQALSEFRNDPGFQEILTALDENPLPHTLVIRPYAEAAPAALDDLERELIARSDVDMVKLDTEWVTRLNAILDLARRAVWIAAVMLVGAVIVIIGNTTRLDIQNRRSEIEVSKLLGASDGFVRRPFLYMGFWYGLFGACFALILLTISLWLLNGPVDRLVSLYGGGFERLGVDFTTFLAVLGGGVTAGLGGAWSAVARHLSAIQPQV
jgi:cell division transport system permease protein